MIMKIEVLSNTFDSTKIIKYEICDKENQIKSFKQAINCLKHLDEATIYFTVIDDDNAHIFHHSMYLLNRQSEGLLNMALPIAIKFCESGAQAKLMQDILDRSKNM